MLQNNVDVLRSDLKDVRHLSSVLTCFCQLHREQGVRSKGVAMGTMRQVPHALVLRLTITCNEGRGRVGRGEKGRGRGRGESGESGERRRGERGEEERGEEERGEEERGEGREGKGERGERGEGRGGVEGGREGGRGEGRGEWRKEGNSRRNWNYCKPRDFRIPVAPCVASTDNVHVLSYIHVVQYKVQSRKPLIVQLNYLQIPRGMHAQCTMHMYVQCTTCLYAHYVMYICT